MKKSLATLILFVVAGAANATSYYVSDCGAGASGQCVAGSDTNAGTDPAAPWKTCAKVAAKFSSLAAGDKVLFARGSAQTACMMNMLSNLNSRAINPITIGAYTPSWATTASPNPVLNGAPSAYTLGLSNGGTSTHDEGYVVQDLHFVGSGITSTVPSVMLTNDVDNVTVQRIEIEQSRGGIQCSGGTPMALASGSDGLTEHIVIRESNIHHNRGIGILLSCNDSLIENNTLDNNGVGMLDHHIYISDAAVNNVAQTTRQVVIRNNRLTNNSTYASTTAALPTPGGCAAVAIVVHGLKDGIIIENNLVSEPTVPSSGGCWGITVDSGGYTGIYAKEGFTNVVIRSNTVVNYSMGIGVDICDTCTVENNNIYSEFPSSAGIVAPSKYNVAAIPGNTLNNKLTVRNNTVYLKTPSAGSAGIRVSRDGTNHTVVSNLVYFGGTSTTSTSCFNTSGLATTAFAVFDYNLCYFSAVAGKWDATRGALSAQQTAGLDAHSQTANPLLSVPVAPLFTMSMPGTSPAVKMGHPTLSSKLANGGLRRDGASDIGAFQQGASVVVPNSPTGLSVQ